MTEPRFEELINLYLDNEIGRHELGELKHAIRDNVLRRQKFERACQLHQAARKALAERAEGTVNEANGVEGNEAPNSQAAPVRSFSHSTGRRSQQPVASKGKDWVSQKQSHAHRNASVLTLAERQSSKGAASTVDLGKISLNPSRSSPSSLRPKSITFFDSPVGMVVAILFMTAGAFGLYLLFKVSSNGTENDGSQGGESAVVQRHGSIDEKELMRELQGHRKDGADPAEAMRATLYQSAAGRPIENSIQGNSTSTPTTTEGTSPNATVPNAMASDTEATMTVRVAQATIAESANSGVSMVNSSQLQVTLPAGVGATGDQGLPVNMSLPPLITPPSGSGNIIKSENGTVPAVNLP